MDKGREQMDTTMDRADIWKVLEGKNETGKVLGQTDKGMGNAGKVLYIEVLDGVGKSYLT